MKNQTEIALASWREGQTQAERLCAGILQLDGFASVDPQCPLGGPDGLKDVLCEKNGWKYVAAAYFPPKTQELTAIRKKFLGDLRGVGKNKADGIIFVTNQSLTPKQRQSLTQEANAKSHKSLIYHCERIRVLLDSAQGFGLRMEHLGIPMSKEEQVSFFAFWNNSLLSAMQDHSNKLRALTDKLAVIEKPFAEQIKHLSLLIESTRSQVRRYLAPPLMKAPSRLPQIDPLSPATSLININMLCMIHRALTTDSRVTQYSGKLRPVQVWIGAPGSGPKTASFLPPPAAKVPRLTERMLEQWRSNYVTLSHMGPKKIIYGLALFHHAFLSIHPFLDGNGRVARFSSSTAGL